MGARILGIASAVPSKVVTNHDLERLVDTSDEWITTRTGIRERRHLEPGEDCSDMVARAASRAIERAGLTPADIDVMIVGTATPDTVFPSTACWAQPKVGLGTIPVLDISAACSGFLYGYQLADSLITSGRARHVLVVGAEALSRVMNWSDRTTCVLFGDGAGAAVIGPGEHEKDGLLASSWGADGRLASLLWQPAGGTRHPATEATVAERMHTVHMAGNEVFKHAVRAMKQAVGEVLEQAGLTNGEIDLFVPHQANVRIIKATADRARVPMEKTYLVIHKYGNVSAASIPMALADAAGEGRLKRGDLVLSASFGAGFTWAAALYRW
ncbi:MAG: beta-ketoacyl-ACP synthase III [Acidobacteriota bacterium]|nr:beta-ketoacyl-ACP synthase III [Acidobacteriota bacterium]